MAMYNVNPPCASPHVLRLYAMVLSVLPDMYQFLVPFQRLPHVKGIFAFRQTRWIVAVVSLDCSEHTVSAS